MKGKISQIIGAVIDVAFEGEIPNINDALKVGDLILEVQQHLGSGQVRTIAMSSTDGLHRGQEVEALGEPISVPVGEEVTYKYDISYVPLAAALVLIALALIMLGFYYSTPYKLVKSVTVQKKGKEKFIGIQLALKNKTGKKQKNIMIEDYVPIPLVVSREFGTMSPTAIRKQKDKLALTWKFDELQPREERMLSYKMKSKLEVDGKIGIPAANVTQKVGKKKIQIFSKILRA